jgi:hypothetical protein
MKIGKENNVRGGEYADEVEDGDEGDEGDESQEDEESEEQTSTSGRDLGNGQAQASEIEIAVSGNRSLGGKMTASTGKGDLSTEAEGEYQPSDHLGRRPTDKVVADSRNQAAQSDRGLHSTAEMMEGVEGAHFRTTGHGDVTVATEGSSQDPRSDGQIKDTASAAAGDEEMKSSHLTSEISPICASPFLSQSVDL